MRWGWRLKGQRPSSVRAEPVEAPCFRRSKGEGEGFDKLSPNGWGSGRIPLPPLRQPLAQRLRHLAPGRAEAFEDVDEADLVHRAGVAEAFEAFMAVLGADAAGADAAERETLLGDMEQGAVQCD